jgi:hypothetical protein
MKGGLVVGHFSARDAMKGTLREGFFTGDPKRYVKQGLKTGVCFHRGPLLGNMKGCFILRAFLFRGIFMRFSREMQMTCKWVSLSIGAPLGNLEGVRLPGLLRE